MNQFAYQLNFSVIDCANCGMPFGLSTDYENRRRADGKSFMCPEGHSQSFTESKISKLEKEVAREKRLREWAENSRDYANKRLEKEKHRAAAFKGHLSKTKKRISHGVCPCCNRTFQNVASHMKSQHPNYVEAEQ